jgi:hypothetical protein
MLLPRFESSKEVAMREDHQKQQTKGEVQTETGEMLKGPKPLKQGSASGSKQLGGKSVNEAGKQQQHQGDERTPEKSIGEVAYANRDPAKKKTGEF